jgi:hypothetical protein
MRVSCCASQVIKSCYRSEVKSDVFVFACGNGEAGSTKSNTCQIATVNQAKEAMHRKTKDRKY